MTLHPTTFDYLRPSEEQVTKMAHLRNSCAVFAYKLDAALTDGPDKTYILRKFREVAMWINVTLTRNADGSPRED